MDKERWTRVESLSAAGAPASCWPLTAGFGGGFLPWLFSDLRRAARL